MLRNIDRTEKASSKRRTVMAAGTAFLLLTVIVCTCILKSTRAEQREREETAQIFKPYESYGLVYNEKENRLYFNGGLVRYFEDIVSDDYYIKWPNHNGTADVYAKRDASGKLAGVSPFSKQAFSDRTPSLENAVCDLEISNTISMNGYTDDVDEMVQERISEEYGVYRQYGLIYDMESERLYYEGELVGYFEDKQKNHYFGPYEDSPIKIYANRDRNGNLTGLDADGVTK